MKCSNNRVGFIAQRYNHKQSIKISKIQSVTVMESSAVQIHPHTLATYKVNEKDEQMLS